jgi:hypothetical protein
MKLDAIALITAAAAAGGTGGRVGFRDASAFSPSASAAGGPAAAAALRFGRSPAASAAGRLGMVSAYGTAAGGRIDVGDEYAPRDVYAMEEWAAQCGVQKADGVQ